MRFKVDENLPKDAVALLCAAGHPAISAHGQRMSGAEDRTLFEVCRSEHRVMLTLDLDFADILNYPSAHSPGIVVLRLARQDKRRGLPGRRGAPAPALAAARLVSGAVRRAGNADPLSPGSVLHHEAPEDHDGEPEERETLAGAGSPIQIALLTGPAAQLLNMRIFQY